VLSAAVGLARLEPVARQRKVAQGARLMNGSELAPRHPGNVLKLEHRLAVEDGLRVLVPEALDHRSPYSALRLLASGKRAPVSHLTRKSANQEA
jgi:hypothetical protein